MTVFKIMDGSLCYSNYPTREAAEADLKKLQVDLENQLDEAEQDLADHKENMKIVEVKVT